MQLQVDEPYKVEEIPYGIRDVLRAATVGNVGGGVESLGIEWAGRASVQFEIRLFHFSHPCETNGQR
jgi:hypothetical protein